AAAGAADELPLLRRVPRRGRPAVPLPSPPRVRRRHDRRDDVRSLQGERENRSEEIRGTQMIALLLALLAIGPGPPQRQAAGRGAVTVVDQTGAIIPNATVTITSLEDAKKAIEPAKTNEKGIASFAGLAPGRYKIQAQFPGFEIRLLPDIRLKTGDNKHVAVLNIEGLQDSVTVSRDKQEIASDRRATFG